MSLPRKAPRSRRILLKLSGEALMGDASHGIDSQVLSRIAAEVAEVVANGVQTGLVVGAGNLLRGKSLAAAGVDRVTGDHMGMLATVINALALADALRKLGVPVQVMSAIGAGPLCETFQREQAIRYLEAGHAVIFAAGTGNPLFTTDSAASLRAIEIGADLLLKATKVDGVYSADPMTDVRAERYRRISYDEVLQRELGVMDLTAVLLCRDHGMDLIVFNLNKPGALQRVLSGEDEGTVVGRGLPA